MVCLFVMVLILAGCAGQAKYTLEPVILDTPDGQKAVCCEVTINNSKNIGKLKTRAAYNPDTNEFSVTLEEEGVDASGPAAEANKASAEIIRQLIPLVNK